MGEKQLFVKPMLVELNKTTGGQMKKKDIIDIAIEYGDIKFRLGQISVLKYTLQNDDTKEEYEELNKKRNEVLMKLLDASLEP